MNERMLLLELDLDSQISFFKNKILHECTRWYSAILSLISALGNSCPGSLIFVWFVCPAFHTCKAVCFGPLIWRRPTRSYIGYFGPTKSCGVNWLRNSIMLGNHFNWELLILSKSGSFSVFVISVIAFHLLPNPVTRAVSWHLTLLCPYSVSTKRLRFILYSCSHLCTFPSPSLYMS